MNIIVGVAVLIVGAAWIASSFASDSSHVPAVVSAVLGCFFGSFFFVPGILLLVLAPGIRKGRRGSIIASIVAALIGAVSLVFLAMSALLQKPSVGSYVALLVACLCSDLIWRLARALTVPGPSAGRGFEPVMPTPPQQAPLEDEKHSA